MISQGVGEYKKGDKVNTMISGSAPGIGLVYKKPAGEPAGTERHLLGVENRLSSRSASPRGAASDLGFSRDRQCMMRTSATADVRWRPLLWFALRRREP